MSDFKKRNIIIGALCGVLLLMIVGYAAFQSVLNINGTANITSSWNVLITNIEEKEHVGDATSVEGYPTHGDLTATFQTNLSMPGDSIEYEITVENRGDIDGVLKRVTLSDSDNPAIKFTTIGLLEGELLNSGKSKVFTVKVEYDSNVTSQPESTTSELTVTLEYTQKNVDEDNIAHPQLTKVNMKGVDVPLVTDDSGLDGLYEDEYEIGRYVYKGGNPDNYITFNGEEAGWRIIAIEPDGTIKIIRNFGLEETKPFDDVKINNRTEGYCAIDDRTLLFGCNAFAKTDNFSTPDGKFQGKVTKDSYIKTYLNEEYYNTITTNKDDIQTHEFYYGSIVYNDRDNLAKQISYEKRYSVMTNIGLIQLSDYFKANSNKEQCGTFLLHDENYDDICRYTNYLFHSDYIWWTITSATNPTYEYDIRNKSGWGNSTITISQKILPVLYLKSTIELSGSGTQKEPFNITN